MKRDCIIVFTLAGVLLAACNIAPASEVGSDELSALPTLEPTPVPTDTLEPSLTPDPCTPGNAVEISMRPLLDLQREFDDARAIASAVPQSDLEDNIKELQAIRRDVEDTRVPDCLSVFKDEQITYMNRFIETLLAFLSAAPEIEPDEVEMINELLEASNAQRIVLEAELWRLRGVTLTPSPTASTPQPESP